MAPSADPRQGVARRRRGRPGGITLLEATVSVTILAVVLQTSISATLVMSKSGQFGMTTIESGARAQQSLHRLAAELRTSSATGDENGDPCMEISGEQGRETLVFKRIVQFGSNGAEVVPMWSTPIELLLQGGNLVRRQDQAEAVVAHFVETLDFEIDELGRVDVQVGVARPAGGDEVQRSVHSIRVSPQR